MMILKKIVVFAVLTNLAIHLLAQSNPNASYIPPAFADTNRAAKIKALAPVIEKMYADFAEANHFPGYAFGIVIDGQLIVSGSKGYSDINNKVSATTNSMFRIASMSKSFTALAICKLRDAGKLQLDDAVSKYIPEFKNQGLTKDAPEITIRQLLTHAAGFPEDNPWGDRQLADTDEELLALIKKGISFSNANGIAYEYSNLGFATLGYIIKKVTGIPYSDYIQNNIWKKLGMQAAWEYGKVPANQLAKGYRWINNDWREEALLHDGIYGAMGGMITSIESFSKYMALHQNAWPARNEQETALINRSTIREMHQPWNFNSLSPNYTYSDGRKCATTSAYGYGLAIRRDCDNRLFVGHSGGLPGFGSNWNILPEYGLGVMLFANVTYAPTSAINIRMIDTLVKLAGLKPRQLTASNILNQRKTAILALLPNYTNAKQSGIFADNFFDDYFTDSLKNDAIKIFDKIGKIVSVKELIPENQLRGSFIIECEKGSAKVSFTLTPENPGLIQEYRFRLMN
jgi:CubicO group peptidase (beta-lactamase class C family)